MKIIKTKSIEIVVCKQDKANSKIFLLVKIIQKKIFLTYQTLPYLKIELLEKRELAHRQTASSWLKKLTNAGILKPQKIGRTTYYVNYRLMELMVNN